jgi:hypothetical protein
MVCIAVCEAAMNFHYVHYVGMVCTAAGETAVQPLVRNVYRYVGCSCVWNSSANIGPYSI